MVKAVIFDRDGVLLDSNKVICRAYRLAAEELGYDKMPRDEDIRSLLGIPYQIIVEKILGRGERILEVYSNVWKTRELEKEIKPMHGLEKMLEEIKLPKAIVTSGSSRLTSICLKDSLKYFEVMVAESDVTKHKPDPEPLLLACEKLGVEPGETVYVGDTVTDYETARNAGAKFIGFLGYGSGREDFEAAGAEMFIESLEELPDAVKNL